MEHFTVVIMSGASLYLLMFFIIVIPGLTWEHIQKSEVKKQIRHLLKAGPTQTKILRSRTDLSRTDHTLGGILNEMERAGIIRLVSNELPLTWELNQPPS